MEFVAKIHDLRISQGKSYREISEELGVSSKTIAEALHHPQAFAGGYRSGTPWSGGRWGGVAGASTLQGARSAEPIVDLLTITIRGPSKVVEGEKLPYGLRIENQPGTSGATILLTKVVLRAKDPNGVIVAKKVWRPGINVPPGDVVFLFNLPVRFNPDYS